MISSELKTACHAWHVENGGRMVDFAGWDMPVQYSTIVTEHEAVRSAAGLFDVAHMGRLWFTGSQAEQFLSHVLTLNSSKLVPGQVKYGFVLNEEGGILDDILLYRDVDKFMLVVNASNREKIVSWFQQHQTDFDVEMTDRTTEQFMCAIQGPKSVEILQPHTESNLSELKYYTSIETTLFGKAVFLSRTGYTGEDGFEIILPAEQGTEIWQEIMTAGEAVGIQPAGLGCRDTLRLEAAMPLYGHELNDQIDPLTAGLRFGVHLKGTNFIGHDVLEARLENPKEIKRVGLELDGKRIAREGSTIHLGDQQVGDVTSGTFSPTLQKSLSMGYIQTDLASPGTEIEIEIRGKRVGAKVVELPFYKRAK